MPIVFAQPEPMAPATSVGYGAAEQWSKDLPQLTHQQDTLSQIYMNALRVGAQHGGGNLAAAAQIQQGNAQRQQQADQSGNALAQQASQFQQQQGNAYGLQQQHFDLQQSLASSQLSQREALRLQQLQNALGEVNAQVQSGALSQEDGDEMALHLKTGIDPYVRRQSEAAMKTQALHQRQIEQQMAHQDNLMSQRLKFLNGSFEDRTINRIDDQGNPMTFVLGLDGGIDWHATQFMHEMRRGGRPGTAGGTGSGSGGSGGGGTGGNAGVTNDMPTVENPWAGVRDADRIRIMNEAGHAVDKEVAAAQKAVADSIRRFPDSNNQEHLQQREELPTWARTPEGIRARKNQRMLESAQALRTGQGQPANQFNQGASFQAALSHVQEVAPEMPAQMQRELAQRMMRRERDSHGRQGLLSNAIRDVTRDQRLGLQPDANQPRGQETPEPQPYDHTRPQTMTPGQTTAEDRFTQLRTHIENTPGWTAEQRQLQLRRVEEARAILREFGDVSRMPPYAASNFNHLMGILGRIREPRQQTTETARESAGRGGWALTNEILGSPERLGRFFSGPAQRPFGATPYQQ